WRLGFGRGWLPGGEAIVCGLRGSRGTSLVHGSTTELEVGHARHRSAHQLGCHLGCADASALARDHEIAIGTRATAPGDRSSFKSMAAERSRRWSGGAAERDEPWI